jgi:L-proline---[L-prolyl-carrier protein] ligase
MMLQDLLSESAARFPEHTAVVGPDGTHTYRQLDLLAARGARALAAAGVGPGDRVALWSNKSARGLAAMQSILRAGAVYVPLDAASPPARIAMVLRACSVRVLLLDAEHRALLREDNDISCVVLDIATVGDEDAPVLADQADVSSGQPDDSTLAYILFTSGSTGVPKGVCVSHRAALACILPMAECVQGTPLDRFANHAGWHFDISVLDIYIPYRVGAAICLLLDAAAFAPESLVRCILEYRVSVWYSVPSALSLILTRLTAAEASSSALRLFMFGGDFFPLQQLRQLQTLFPKSRLLNVYGPTEANLCAYYEIVSIPPDRIAPMPIGSGCCGDHLWARKEDGTVASMGEVGELIIEGPTVMTGYWGKPSLEEPQYATGDTVRVCEEGFEFLGRNDWMVKVRGYRIELGEVDSVLQAHPEVSDAAAIAVGSGAEARLVAWVVRRNTLTLKELRRFCAARLPKYMLVDEVLWRAALPYSRNGKIDRARLRDEYLAV